MAHDEPSFGGARWQSDDADFRARESRISWRGFWNTFLVTAFCYSLLFFLFLSACFTGRYLPLSEAFGLALSVSLGIGITCGLLFALVSRTVSEKIVFDDAEIFVKRLDTHLREIGYHPASHSDNLYVYDPGWRVGVLMGRLYIILGDKQARIVGPRLYAPKLRRRLEGTW